MGRMIRGDRLERRDVFLFARLGRLRIKFRSQQGPRSPYILELRQVLSVLVAQSCLTLCDPMDCSLPGFLCPWDSPGRNTGVGSHSLLQTFLTQGLNLGLLHCRQILYCLNHQGSPGIWRSRPKCTVVTNSSDARVFSIPFLKEKLSVPCSMSGLMLMM